MYSTILFDLDGTLLPMEQEVFTKTYFHALSAAMEPHGYPPKELIDATWAGTAAMVKNNGMETNETVFWKAFAAIFGDHVYQDIPIFDNFYSVEFECVRTSCGFSPAVPALISRIKEAGCNLILATNPLFPRVATEARIRWAGLSPADFSCITTYETSHFCKPNPDYYKEIIETCKIDPASALMVGNDAEEDMAAKAAGMDVFLLTDCLINKKSADLSAYPHGSFDALEAFLVQNGTLSR